MLIECRNVEMATNPVLHIIVIYSTNLLGWSLKLGISYKLILYKRVLFVFFSYKKI